MNEKTKSDWPALLLLFVGLPLAFMYGGLWIGLIVLVIGVVSLGWSKRHEGPFPTNQNSNYKMSEINIESLATQFKGRKFGELVLHHMENQSFEQIVAAMQGTIEGLPLSIQKEIENLIDNANSLAHKKEFWADDCGQILKFIVSATQKELRGKGVIPTEDNIFDVFNLIVMNFAYSAYKDPKMKKFIKTSVGKGIFNWIFD